MKQTIKKILVWILCLASFFVVATLVISFVYKDKITKFVVNELGSKIEGKVNIEGVSLSFFASFPNISIQLNNVTALSTESFNKNAFSTNSDTALVAEAIALAFNPINFFQEKYIVEEIIGKNAYANIFIDSDGNHNFAFVKESSDTVKSNTFLELSKIRLKNTFVHYYNASGLQEHVLAKNTYLTGEFTEEGFVFYLNGKILHKKLVVNNYNYLENIELEASIEVEQLNHAFVVKSAKIENDFINLSSNGNISWTDLNPLLNFTYSIAITDIQEAKTLLPAMAQTAISEINLSGAPTIDGTLNSTSKFRKTLALDAKINYKNGSVKINGSTINFATSGVITSGNISNLGTFSYSQSNLSCNYNGCKFNGSVSVQNFKSPELKINGKYVLDLPTFLKDFDLEYNFAGVASGNILWEGNVNEFTDFKESFFTKTRLKASCSLKNAKINAPENLPFNFSDLNANVKLSNNTIQIDTLNGKINEIPFTAEGTIMGLLSSLMFDNTDVTYAIDFKIDKLHPQVFIENLKTSKKDSESPKNKSIHKGMITFFTKDFEYNVFKFQDFKTVLNFNSNTFELKNTNLKTLGGSYKGETKVVLMPNGNTHCKGNANIQNASTKNLFKTFNNFDQNTLTCDKIDGTICTNVDFNVLFNKDFEPIYPKMNVLADVKVENGSIKDFEPFIKISEKLKVPEFENVSFSKIENTIKISQDTLYIPKMDISTNAFDITMEGKHSFNNSFLYALTVYMEKTLSNRYKNKNKEIENFGEIEQDADGKVKIPLKIYGNVNKYKIDYDFKQSIKNVKKSISNQKSEWREILGKPAESNEPQKVEEPEKFETDFEIEFD